MSHQPDAWSFHSISKARPAYPVAAAPPAALPPACTSLTLPVRRYPTEEAAAATGTSSGNVISSLHGKGTLTLNVNAKPMPGEATRTGGANGPGERLRRARQ